MARRPHTSLHAPLSTVTVEGALATVFIVLTGGAFLTGLALLWGANDFQIGLLASIPFLAQIAQLGSAWLIDRTGLRKTITIWSSVLARQVWWLLIPVLFLPTWPRLELLVGVVIISSVATMVATVGWMTWMADLVPDRIRGRYFGVRSAAVALSTMIATIGGGIIIDAFADRNTEETGFALIIGIGALFALAAVILLNRIPDKPTPAAPIGYDRLTEPLREPSFKHLLRVFFVWNFAIGIAAPFFAPHMLTNLNMSFTIISIYTSAAAIVAILLNRPWGILIDRFGCKPVMVVTSFGVALVPVAWFFAAADSLWILIPEVIYSAAMWTGFNLAAFNIPIAHSPKGRRSVYLAMYAVITGLGFFVASLVGGYLAQTWADFRLTLGGLTFINYHLLFTVSVILRIMAGFYVTTFHEPKEVRLPVMIQFMGYTVLKFLSLGRQIFPNPPRLEEK